MKNLKQVIRAKIKQKRQRKTIQNIKIATILQIHR